MTIIQKYKLLLVFVTSVLISSCASISPTDEQKISKVWPEPPAVARISYVKDFFNPESLGIEKSVWQKVVEFFTGEELNRMLRPGAIVVDSENRLIYVADSGVKGIHRYDLKNGSYDLLFRKDNMPLPSPVGLALGTSGEVFVTDSALAKVFSILPNAKRVYPIMDNADLKQPTGIAYDRLSGNIFVVDTANHNIKVLSRAGELVNTIGRRGNGDSEFNFPTLLWLDKKGQLLVTDSLNFRVQVLTRAGEFVREFGKPGDATGTFSRPKGIATDQFGHIYVVDSMFHGFQIFNEKGSLLLHIGEQGHNEGEFWLPSGIFIASDDTIYIADTHNRRVQMFRYIGGAL